MSTTSSRRRQGYRSVNADEIAAARWPGAQAEHSYEAARIAEAVRREHIAGGASLISETVFSHPSKVQLVAEAIEAGYLVHLHVIIIPVELAVQRVLERERRGGHSVPEHKIRERHDRLWTHVRAAIQLADVTDVFDNSRARTPFRRCATFAQCALLGTPAWPRWAPIDLVHHGPGA